MKCKERPSIAKAKKAKLYCGERDRRQTGGPGVEWFVACRCRCRCQNMNILVEYIERRAA